jgi:hypothetical protein
MKTMEGQEKWRNEKLVGEVRNRHACIQTDKYSCLKEGRKDRKKEG